MLEPALMHVYPNKALLYSTKSVFFYPDLVECALFFLIHISASLCAGL